MKPTLLRLLKEIPPEKRLFLLAKEWVSRTLSNTADIPADWLAFLFDEKQGVYIKHTPLPVDFSCGAEGTHADLTPETLALVHETQSISRREKGLYYTPWETASLLVQQTLSAFLKHSAGISSQDTASLLNGKNPFSTEKSQHLDNQLARLRVLDPAVGAGGLLIPFWLTLAHLRHLLNPAISYGELLLFILKHNLFGGDKDPQALHTLRLRAGLTLLQEGVFCPPEEIGTHLFCKDSLSTDEQGKLDWFALCPQVFHEGGFDIILANPPYVGQKNNAEIFKHLRKNPYWKARLTPKGDLLYLFFHLGLDLLRPQGIGGFLTTSYYAQAAGAEDLRNRLRHETALLHLTDFGNEHLFKQAQGQHNLMTVFQKFPSLRPFCQVGGKRCPQDDLFSGENHFLQICAGKEPSLQTALCKMAAAPLRLKDCARISNGLMTGCDKISSAHLQRFALPGVEKGDGVFILSRKEKEALCLSPREKEKLKPFFKNSHIAPYAPDFTPKFFLIDFFCPQDRAINTADYPGLMAHLSRFKPVLLARKQNNNGIDKELKKGVYWLGSVRRKMNFEEEKLVVPHRSPVNTFAYAPGPWYASSDVYFISRTQKVSLWYLLGLFNSAPYYAWLFYRGKRKGHLLELYSAPLSQMPVPIPSRKRQEELENLAKEIFSLKKQNPKAVISSLQHKADLLVCQILGFTSQETEEINRVYLPEMNKKKI